MRRLISSPLPLLACLLLSDSPGLSDEPDGARLRFLASALDRKIDEVGPGALPLSELLETLSKQASLPGHEKDPTKRVTIDCNRAFKKRLMDFDPERERINFSKKVTGERLDTILRSVCKGLSSEGVVFVREHCIEIIPREMAIKELQLHLAEDEPMPVLIHQFFVKVPLDKALKQISDRYGRNIILAPMAELQGATPITASLVNVPIDDAVQTLANMAKLKAIRKTNISYVTTKEQADTLLDEEAKATKEIKKTPKMRAP